MKIIPLIMLVICLAFLNLANAQKKALIHETSGIDSKVVVTPETIPEKFTVDLNGPSKTTDFEVNVPGKSTIHIKIKPVEGKKEAEVIIKKGNDSSEPGQKVTVMKGDSPDVTSSYRPDVVEPVFKTGLSASDAIEFVSKSKISPVIQSFGGQISKSNINLMIYEKIGFNALSLPIFKDGEPTYSFAVVYKFPSKHDETVLFRLLGDRQIELVDGKTGEKGILRFTEDGQLKTGSPETSWLFPSFVGKAYAFDFGPILECIATVAEKTPDWGPACVGCFIAVKKFSPKLITAACLNCFYELIGMAGSCYKIFVR